MKQDQRKILLIEPPFYRLFKDTYSLDRYPLSLGYLAGTIRKETNWSVMAYNSDFSPESETVKVSHLAGAGFNNYLNNLKELIIHKKTHGSVVQELGILTIKIASEIGAQMKLRFVTLMLPMLNFGSNSVERSRSAVTMGIQSSDFVR